ncbi:hypothetical protein LJR231_003463 [Phyllobacterium sp. LjRoot231]|uniref:hypothetical protein n=1 Tax=Phyllobacterium sp. LjRoot231 TaxID=3342289 RepID=UPI003ECC4A31
MIPFAEFAPDKSVFDPSACNTLQNVLPQAQSFGPFPSFVPLTDPLPARPQGSILANEGAGQYTLITGTETGIYKLNAGTLGWDNISGGVYGTADSANWSFEQFGTWVTATNGTDPVQYYDLSAPTTFGVLSANAPTALYSGIIGDFIMLLNTSGGSKTIQWSGLNDPQFWIPRQRSSDLQPFPDGGEIMGFSGFEKGGVIFHENCIREGALALDTALIMTFRKTIESHGCVAPRSIVTTGAGIFYLSQDGFYLYGAPPTPIGNERVDRFFIDDIATEETFNVYGSEDPIRKIVYWAYRSRANTLARSYDKVLVYNYGTDKWSMLIPGAYLTGLIEATTPGYTLDSLDSLGIPLDDLPYSLDSRAWSGGSPTLAAFDTDFRLGFFSGSPLEAILQTGAVGLSQTSRTAVRGFRALCDAETTTGRVATRDRAGQMDTWKSSFACNRTGLIPARASGRFHRFELTIPANQAWEHVHGIDPDGKTEGQQ